MRRFLLVGLAMLACHPGSTWVRDPVTGTPALFLGYRPPPAMHGAGPGELGAIAPRLASALRRSYDRHDGRPPVSLVPTDGSELALRQLTADVQIRGPLAHTELHFTFHNDQSRVREGRFTIAMPDGAAVSRFAMKIGDTWREARVVARTKGRAVYESYLHRRVDPALLERDADQRFTARVFPIAADADKEIILGYDHVVGAGVPYVLRLRGLPAVPVAIAIDQDGVSQQRTTRGAPGDVVLAAGDGNAAVAVEDAFVARIAAPAGAVSAALDRVLVLIDTSASRAAIMAQQAAAVRGLLAGVRGDTEIAVAVFDHTVRELYRGPARDARGIDTAMLEHGALGASRLDAALGYAARAGLDRVIVIGDVVATLGERDPARLAALVTGSAILRLDVVQLGDAIDLPAARAITGAAREPGAILDGRDLDRVVRQLALALPPEQPIAVAGATATWPATTRGVAPGDPIFVYGRYAGGPGALAVTIGDRTTEVLPRRGEPRAVRRAVAGADLASLAASRAAETDPVRREALRGDIERIALDHGLVSSETSLLTLESDAEERRVFGPPDGSPGDAPGDPATGPPADVTPELSDAELAKLAESEGKAEMITITGSLIGSTETYSGTPSVIDEHRGALGAVLDPPRWGEASPQRPSIILDRDRTPYTPVSEGTEPPAWLLGHRFYVSPYTGALRDVMTALAAGDLDAALARAVRARGDAPDDVAAILALGEALEARGAGALAARAYGSLIDLFPSRDELVRTAGERLDRIGGPAREDAVEAYRRALAERPDRIVGHRRLGYALARLGRWREAIDVLAEGLAREGRASVTRIVREDIALIAAAAIAAAPDHAAAIRARLDELAIAPATTPSLRFVLSWETDANDVDLHVFDRSGNEAYYGARTLPSGGALLDDVTDGFGPEMLSIDRPDAFPYRLAVHYYARGPEGVGLGAIQIIRHDGHGHLTVEDRPFAIQVDDGAIDLGTVAR